MKNMPDCKNFDLVLASASPRRKALLEEYGVDFRIAAADAEEISIPENGVETVKANALAKAEKVFDLLRAKEDEEGDLSRTLLVLGADTVIESGNRVLGKPSGISDAENMLLSLSGKTHKVITGVALLSPQKRKVFAVTTFVTFRKLSPENIRSYMSKVFVLDKAGAYAAQEHGDMIIEKMEGSMENVVGLPVAEILEELKNW